MKFIKEEIYQALQYQRSHNTSLTKAAQQYGIDRHTLASYHDFDFSQCIYDKDNQQYIKFTPNEQAAIDAYKNGTVASAHEVRHKFHLHQDKFQYMCRLVGMQPHNAVYKRTFNRNALHTIQTEQDAYLLGFITADGYLCETHNSVRIRLSERDVDILIKINEYMQSDVPITQTPHSITGNYLCQLDFNDKGFLSNLKQYGLHQAKSLKEIFYQDIPEHLMRHYIRGLIDGDGYISKNTCHIGICGSQDIVQNVAKHLQQVAGVPPEKQRNARQEKDTSLYRFELCGENARAAMRWLYEGSNIHLDRKYNLAKQYINLL